MGRPKPFGRDRLGILSRVFAGAGATDTDAEYAIGTNDAMIRVLGSPEKTDGETLCYLFNADDATVIRMGIRYADNKPFIEIGGNTYVSDTAIPVSPWGRVVDLKAELDRSASCYFYCDGAACGSIDISADVATDIDSDTAEIGGRLVATEGWSGVTLMAQLFVYNGALPDATDRLKIAQQQFGNPDSASPVLAARANYATERRVDVDFVDIDQDGTTVTNNGTGGDFTIGGGLRWRNVRTQAERTAITIPEQDWYSLDSTHRAQGTANLSCSQGSYICEAVYKDIIYRPSAPAAVVWEFSADATTEKLYMYKDAADGYNLQARINSAYYAEVYRAAGYAEYGRSGLHVVHQILDADANLFYNIINGQFLDPAGIAVAADLDLSGDVITTFGLVATRDGLLALRLWNAASLPADYATIIKQRVLNPWSATENTFTGMTLRGNWECRIDASVLQGASSTLLKNLANPGTGDLATNGATDLSDCTVLAVKGRG